MSILVNKDTRVLCQGITGKTVDCSADRLIGLAPLKALAGLVYAPDLPIDGRLRLGVSVNYSDKYENSLLGVALAATGSRTLLDASVSYDTPDNHWTFTPVAASKAATTSFRADRRLPAACSSENRLPKRLYITHNLVS